MRFLKVLVIVMGVVIVVATTVLIVLIARRIGGAPGAGPALATSVLLEEPAGTRIAAIAAVGDRLAVQLQGGGGDRFLVVYPRWGGVGGWVGLRGQP
jgi:uncharacterized membrane protein